MKKQNDYFDMMEELSHFSAKAADLMVTILGDFKPEEISARRDEMHAIEHAADGSRHETLQKLSREFITPIERDDILQLVQIIDDVTDSIDEVMINLYMFNIRALTPDTLKLALLVSRCVHALEASVKELRNFKKSTALKTLIIEVNTLESDADDVYIEAMRTLFTSGQDAVTIMGLRDIYDCLESCCDLCERAADVIENTVMNNT